MKKEEASGVKSKRVLQLYSRLLNGEVIHKKTEAEAANVTPRSIQRDIEDIRAFLEEQEVQGNSSKELVYSRKEKGYMLCTKDTAAFSNSEVLAVCKILLESRAFCREELEPMIRKLIQCGVPRENRAIVSELISNELFHYIEPQHRQKFLDSLWDIGMAVKEHRMLKLLYRKQDGTEVERKVKPVGIMFSEFYFYLTAFIEDIDREAVYTNKDDIFPTIYRIDRIKSFEITQEKFNIPYRDRFEEGEFRRRIQFMYGGKLRHIRFWYKGRNVEAVLDRLPTAKIMEQNEKGWLLSAEVFGDGVDMWIRSQGSLIELV